jgi:hypothetical protein
VKSTIPEAPNYAVFLHSPCTHFLLSQNIFVSTLPSDTCSLGPKIIILNVAWYSEFWVRHNDK